MYVFTCKPLTNKCFIQNYLSLNWVPLGTMMHPPLAVKLMNELIFWVRFKTLLSWLWSGFTVIYGKNYAFCHFLQKRYQWTNGWTDRQTDTATYWDARPHLKIINLLKTLVEMRLRKHDHFFTLVVSWCMYMLESICIILQFVLNIQPPTNVFYNDTRILFKTSMI